MKGWANDAETQSFMEVIINIRPDDRQTDFFIAVICKTFLKINFFKTDWYKLYDVPKKLM